MRDVAQLRLVVMVFKVAAMAAAAAGDKAVGCSREFGVGDVSPAQLKLLLELLLLIWEYAPAHSIKGAERVHLQQQQQQPNVESSAHCQLQMDGEVCCISTVRFLWTWSLRTCSTSYSSFPATFCS